MQQVRPDNWTRQDFIKFYTEQWSCPCIPIRQDKKALIKWADFQRNNPTADQYKQWFVNSSPYGIAIVMREGLFSIDLDTDELFAKLRGNGAFPRGACIYKSRRGYHVIMRADHFDLNYPFSVQEHNDQLTKIDPDYFELGIGGVGHLANVPDTPERLWLPGYLYDNPVTVNYEEWLKENLGYDKAAIQHDNEGDVYYWCPLHPDMKGDPTDKESLCVNLKRNAVHCFGCGWHGNLNQFLEECKKQGVKPPAELNREINKLTDDKVGVFSLGEDGPGNMPTAIIDQLVSGGQLGFTMIAAESGEGKTTLASSLAAAVALGEPAWGKLETQQGTVLVIECERTALMVLETLKTIVTPDKWQQANQNIKVIQKKDNEPDWNIHDPSDRQLIIWLAQRYNPKLVIFDSLLFMAANAKDDDTEWELFRALFSQLMGLGAGVVGLMHTATDPFSDTWTKAYGATGKHLQRWASCKLGFARFESSDYSHISGRTRQWGNVDHLLGYIESERNLILLDPEDLPDKYRVKLPRERSDAALRLFGQLRLLAKGRGLTLEELAGLLEVDRRNFSYWQSGENNISPETYDQMKKVYQQLIERGHEVKTKEKPSLNAEKVPGNITKSPTKSLDKDISPDNKIEKSLSTSDHYNRTSDTSDLILPAKPIEPGPCKCEKCRLKDNPQPILDRGTEGGILILGDVPDEHQKSAFAGTIDTFLSDLLKSSIIDPASIYYTNICQCFPGKDKRGKVKKPGVVAVRACLPRLQATIDKVKPNFIIACGDVALQAFFPNLSTARMHGKRWLDNKGRTWASMIHPREALHGTYYRSIVSYDWEHLLTTPILKIIDGDYRIGELTHLGSFEKTTLDIETTGLTKADKIIGCSITTQPGKSTYIKGEGGIVKVLKDIGRNCKTIRGWNLKFDIQRLAIYGLGYAAFDYDFDDGEVMAYCIGYDDLHLKNMETQELNLWHPTTEEVMGETKTLVDKPVKVVGRYCCQDGDSTTRLIEHFEETMDDREKRLYHEVEKPLLPCLMKMEYEGVRIDKDYVKQWDADLEKKYKKVTKELKAKYSLDEETLDSPAKLGQWLSSQGVKLPKTESGDQLAVGKEVIAAYIDKHPAIGLILQRRQYEKQRTTYAKAYLTLTDENSILHATYNQTRVVTGRLSCSNPNEQNLPHIFEARRPFVARPGNKLVDCDYSQIDMRVLAYLSGDKTLRQAFENDEDVHNMMADMLFGDHEKIHRYLVKSASYMMLYLGTPRGLYIYMNAPMGEFNVQKMGNPPTERECEVLLEKYFNKFPGIPEYHEKTIKFAKENGYVEDYWGRRRYLPEFASSDRGVRKSAERLAVNFPIASTAGGIFKISIIKTTPIWQPIMNVHDELIFDIPEKQAESKAEEIVKAMKSIEFPVPLKVKSEIGNNLGELL